jgi:hypothetical protein
MPSLADTYLIGYNAACCVGWALVLVAAVVAVVQQRNSNIVSALSNVYHHFDDDVLALMLTISQTAAVLEIIHALVGLVRSPVLVTTMQVSSRLVALFALLFSPIAQSQYGAGIMMISWSLVEVPRYGFYLSAICTGDSVKKTPYWLFYLRYSLFAVLYPTGIWGELTVFRAAARDPEFLNAVTFLSSLSVSHGAKLFYGTILPIVYLFGSPYMIFNMVMNRQNAFKKRFAKTPPPPRGIVWPKDAKGERSSTDTNKAILAAAVGAVNPTKATAILKAPKWRFQYSQHLYRLVEEQCASPEAAIKIAQAGLNKAYELFEFIAPDGSAVSLQAAMTAKNTEKFETGFIKGTGTVVANKMLEIPYKGQTLSGQALKDQVAQWVNYGTIEPSAGEAICTVIDNPNYLNLSDRYFCLLGAGSAMGPFLVLMALGANVVAVDLDRSGIWERLITIAKNSSGTLTFPLKIPQTKCTDDATLYANAGCNLFTHTPIIRDWLLNLYPNKPMTISSYAYLDGALHVQVSLAMDAICRDLSAQSKNVSLAYLCTPTDLHLIPKEAHDAQVANYQEYSKRLYCQFLRLVNGKKYLRKNPKPQTNPGGFYIVNGISVAQGPNYALAKRLQHWRAIIANVQNKCIVSSNIAPSTSTVSVIHNRTFAWAYEGMPYFRPYEIFAPETSNAVMSAILFYDLNNANSAGNPNGKTKHANPNQLFSYGAFHGGVWRCAYEIDSIGEASVFLYFGRVAAPYLYAASAVTVGLAAAYVASTKL